jgi:hypothetical protein
LNTRIRVMSFNNPEGLCLKSHELYLGRVSTTCGSGWVNGPMMA